LPNPQNKVWLRNDASRRLVFDFRLHTLPSAASVQGAVRDFTQEETVVARHNVFRVASPPQNSPIGDESRYLFHRSLVFFQRVALVKRITGRRIIAGGDVHQGAAPEITSVRGFRLGLGIRGVPGCCFRD
jgi:hypothetical protein